MSGPNSYHPEVPESLACPLLVSHVATSDLAGSVVLADHSPEQDWNVTEGLTNQALIQSDQINTQEPSHATAATYQSADRDPLTWWGSLDEPLLQLLIADTLASNPNASQALARVTESRALLSRATADSMPQVGSSLLYDNRQFSQNGNAFVQQSASTTGFDFYSTGLQSSWELDLWGQFARRRDAAAADWHAATYDFHDVNVSLTAEVVRAYVELCLANSQLAIAQSNADVMKSAIAIASTRRQAGQVGEMDERLAGSQYKLTIAELPKLELQRQQILNRIAALRGQKASSDPLEVGQFSGELPAAPPMIPIGGLEMLGARPDIRARRTRLIAAAARIKVSKIELLPKLRLHGNVSMETRDPSQWFTNESMAYGVGPTLDWQLLDFGRRRADIRLAEARYLNAKAEYDSSVVTAAEEVRNAIAAMREETKRAELLGDAAQSAAEITEMALLEYHQGIGTFQNVLDAQRQRLSIEAQAATSRASVWVAYVQYYRAIGGVRANCQIPVEVESIKSALELQ